MNILKSNQGWSSRAITAPLIVEYFNNLYEHRFEAVIIYRKFIKNKLTPSTITIISFLFSFFFILVFLSLFIHFFFNKRFNSFYSIKSSCAMTNILLAKFAHDWFYLNRKHFLLFFFIMNLPPPHTHPSLHSFATYCNMIKAFGNFLLDTSVRCFFFFFLFSF